MITLIFSRSYIRSHVLCSCMLFRCIHAYGSSTDFVFIVMREFSALKAFYPLSTSEHRKWIDEAITNFYFIPFTCNSYSYFAFTKSTWIFEKKGSLGCDIEAANNTKLSPFFPICLTYFSVAISVFIWKFRACFSHVVVCFTIKNVPFSLCFIFIVAQKIFKAISSRWQYEPKSDIFLTSSKGIKTDEQGRVDIARKTTEDNV